MNIISDISTSIGLVPASFIMHDDGDTITYIGATLHGHHSCIVDAETLDECIAKLRRLFEMALKHELNTLLNPFRVCVTKNISFPEFPDN